RSAGTAPLRGCSHIERNGDGAHSSPSHARKSMVRSVGSPSSIRPLPPPLAYESLSFATSLALPDTTKYVLTPLTVATTVKADVPHETRANQAITATNPR